MTIRGTPQEPQPQPTQKVPTMVPKEGAKESTEGTSVAPKTLKSHVVTVGKPRRDSFLGEESTRVESAFFKKGQPETTRRPMGPRNAISGKGMFPRDKMVNISREEIRSLLEALQGRGDLSKLTLVGINLGDLNLRGVNIFNTIASPSETSEREQPEKATLGDETTEPLGDEATAVEERPKAEKLRAEVKPMEERMSADAYVVNYKGRDLLFAPPRANETERQNLQELAQDHDCELVEVDQEQWDQIVTYINANPANFIKEEEENKDKKPEDVRRSTTTAKAAGISIREGVGAKDDKQKLAENLVAKGAMAQVSVDQAAAEKRKEDERIKEGEEREVEKDVTYKKKRD